MHIVEMQDRVSGFRSCRYHTERTRHPIPDAASRGGRTMHCPARPPRTGAVGLGMLRWRPEMRTD